MLKGMSRYLLTADDANQKGVQLRADGGFGGSPVRTVSNSAKVNNTVSRTGREKITVDERFEKNLMEDFVNYQNNTFMRKIARDMFFHDPISGQAVEMLAHLPFSDFEVAAVSDEEKEKYVASMNAMHMPELLPEIAQEEMVEGKHASMMNYDDQKGSFTGIIPFDPEACDFTYLPVYGRDPIVNVKVSNYLRDLVSNPDPRVQKELEDYADDVKEMIRANGSFPVPQEYLLYVARRAFSYMPEGVSVFRRIAAVWLFEKNLARGTLDMSSRKQKALMHAVLGDGDEFIPTNQQLAEVGEMIVNAERNPVGAMIVTRPGLDINEVGSNGSDIWRWDEAYDFFTTTKLRGLGLSDAIFGDFSIQSAENTLSSVIEKLSDTRASITNRVLINRVGLTVAVKNDFKKSKKEIEASADFDSQRYSVSRRHQYQIHGADDQFINPNDYNLPQIRSSKVSRLVSNQQLFEALSGMADKNIPVPIRLLAGALGQNVDEFIAGYPEDLKIRKIISEYQAKLPKAPNPDGSAGASGGGEGMDGEDPGLFSEAMDFKSPVKKNRNFDHIRVRDTKTGRELSARGQRAWDYHKNKLIVEAADRIRDHQTRKEVHDDRAREPEKKIYHPRGRHAVKSAR